MALEDFFASSNEEIIAFFIYQTAFFFVFYGSFRPIWAQNEITSLQIKRNKGSKTPTKIERKVIYYGWQTRKRNEWRAGHISRYVLMNPEYFYNGILWMFFYLSGAFGAYYVFIRENPSDLRTIALSLTTTQAFLMGIWTIPGFYWDLPQWSIFILFISCILSTSVLTLYGILSQWTAFGFYLWYTIGQYALTIIYTLALFGLFDPLFHFKNHPYNKEGGHMFKRSIEIAKKRGGHHKHPLGLFQSFWKYGLYPASYVDRDLPWLLNGTYDFNSPIQLPQRKKKEENKKPIV